MSAGSALEPTYRALRAWHRAAGLVVLPVLLLLAVTGALYLWSPDLEAWRAEALPLSGMGPPASPDVLIAAARDAVPDGRALSYHPASAPGSVAEVRLQQTSGAVQRVRLDPVTGGVLGIDAEAGRLSALLKRLHGTLFAGLAGELVVEAVAGWTLVMLGTGLFLWWPRAGTAGRALRIRIGAGDRLRRRDLHAVPAVLATAFIALFLLSGLPWTKVFGGAWTAAGDAMGEGLPREVFGPGPPSGPPLSEGPRVTPADIVARARAAGLEGSWRLDLPKGETGSYAARLFAEDPRRNRFLFFDAHSGDLLREVTWRDYGWLAQVTALGVALHEGRLFGIANKVGNTLVCAALAWIALTGLWQRLARRTGDRVPLTLPRAVWPWAALGAMVLPLFGATLLAVLLTARFTRS